MVSDKVSTSVGKEPVTIVSHPCPVAREQRHQTWNIICKGCLDLLKTCHSCGLAKFTFNRVVPIGILRISGCGATKPVDNRRSGGRECGDCQRQCRNHNELACRIFEADSCVGYIHLGRLSKACERIVNNVRWQPNKNARWAGKSDIKVSGDALRAGTPASCVYAGQHLWGAFGKSPYSRMRRGRDGLSALLLFPRQIVIIALEIRDAEDFLGALRACRQLHLRAGGR